MRSGAIAIAVAVACCAASAQGAFAAGSGVWIASYTAHIANGTEDNTWSIDHQSTGGCDYPETGGGSDMSTYSAGDSVPTTFIGSGASAFSFQLPSLPTELQEDRQDELEIGDAPGDDCQPPTQPSFECEPQSAADVLTFDVDALPEISGSAAPPYGMECPPFGIDAPAFPYPMTLAPPLLGPLAPASERATFTGEEDSDNAGPSGDAKTDTHAEVVVVLDRVLVTDAMTMAPVDAVSVAASGDSTIPVDCPSGSCSGTASVIAAATKNLASDSSVFEATAAKAPKFPQAVTRVTAALAKGHFALRAHQHGITVKWLGGSLVADALASRHITLDLVIEEKAGKHTVDYIPGQIRLRAGGGGLPSLP